jgi:hypothetical protein
MKKVILPPPISPFVDMADMDKAVTKVINVEMAMITNVSPLCQFILIKCVRDEIKQLSHLFLLALLPKKDVRKA